MISACFNTAAADGDPIVVRMTEAQIVAAGDANAPWLEMITVRPMAPAGVTVLYENMLQR